MPPRKVVADSDDDDEDIGDSSPVRHVPAERPEPEPLSPLGNRVGRSLSPVDQLVAADADETLWNGHRVGSSSSGNEVSDMTDPSFFANIYNEQQNSVLQHQQQQQARLIENIVQQSQKAGASSGEVSLSTTGRKRKSQANDPSSGLDIPSPLVVFKKPGDQQSPWSEDATQINTPHIGTAAAAAGGDMWDVPSSSPTENAEGSRGVKKSLTTYGKRRRGNSALSLGSAGSKIFNNGIDDDQDDPLHTAEDEGFGNARHGDDGFVAPSPLPPRKKPKISLYDTTAQNATTFYIAQSNLTTMQKLQYQKVSVPANPPDGMAGSATNPKSSGVTTIAYSTPSYYAAASSGLPLPSTAPKHPDDSTEVIDIPSSPDVMASETGHPAGRKSIFASQKKGSTQDPSSEALPPPPPTLISPSQKKRKNRKRIEEEADELGHDDSWDTEAIHLPGETYKPRPSRSRSTAASIHEGETAEQNAADEPVGLVGTGQYHDTADPAEQAFVSAVPPPTTLEIPTPKEADAPPAAQPKKRGRKKKQPVVEVIQDELPAEEAETSAVDSLSHPVEMEEIIEKPKKKRGRPRKSDQAKATATTKEAPVPPPRIEEPEKLEAPEVAESEEDPFDKDDDGEASEQEVRKPRSNKARQKQSKKKTKEASEDDGAGSREPKGVSSPLKEVDVNMASANNSRAEAPSRSASTESAGKKSAGVAAAATPSDKVQTKAPTKETTATPKPVASSQSKVPHRVGLSKRSRIAPLLKIIKK